MKRPAQRACRSDVVAAFDRRWFAEVSALAKPTRDFNLHAFVQEVKDATDNAPTFDVWSLRGELLVAIKHHVDRRADKEASDLAMAMVRKQIGDLHKTTESVLTAAGCFAGRKKAWACGSKGFERLAMLVTDLSPASRDRLTWASRAPNPPPPLPTPDALRDPTRQVQACKDIFCLAAYGAELKEGRERPDGKQSIDWLDYHINAPSPPRGRPPQNLEEQFVSSIQEAFLKAGLEPPWDADRGKPGPFARLVRSCLKLVGSRADAVGVIRKLHQQRKRSLSWRRRKIEQQIVCELKRGPKTQTEISKLFRGTPNAAIKSVLTDVLKRGRVVLETQRTRGAPRKVWKLVG